jgi:superfamily II DNA or RNA helicase
MTRTDERTHQASPFDFVQLARDIESQYRSYLRTTFHFRDPELRASFDRALRDYALVKGPFVEAVPSFDKADAAPHLLSQLLGAPVDAAFAAALGGDRPLYAHQADAIEKIDAGRNVVVATGTGSGKTEAFLYPILLHLYREHRQATRRPGVRALILYPMNALANDQRDRLRELDLALRAANSQFSFTFGQYIGETPENAGDRRRNADEKQREASPGELVFRDQMRETAPDILLTNYSMLEYLLTRPADSSLFDNGNARDWAFMVLDEAHQYRGANGIEMAMLVRRLRERLREGGRSDDIHCIATSATLGRGEDDREGVAKFASDLFGVAFEVSDVVLPTTRAPVFQPDRTLEQSAYSDLEARHASGSIDSNTLGAELLGDTRAVDVIQRVRSAPEPIASLASHLFPDAAPEAAIESTSSLVRLLSAADDEAGDRLLQARVHLFLRSLEGAFVSFAPTPEIMLNRTARQGAVFEIALCRECGQHYLAGRRAGGRLEEAKRDPGDADFGVTFFRPLDAAAPDDEDIEEDDDKARRLVLCVRCGAVGENFNLLTHAATCASAQVIDLEELPAGTQRDQARKCRTCGYRGQDPIGEVVHGTDGPHAVIATTMFRDMDAAHRKILAFADGRQQAAFFAWYLQNSYEDLLARNLIFAGARETCEHAGTATLRELAHDLERRLVDAKMLSEATGVIERRRTAWRHLYRELLADQRRISLEGVGLLNWSLQWPGAFTPPPVLCEPPWSLEAADALDVVLALFETLRQRRAMSISAEPGVSLDFAELGLRATQVSAKIGAADSRNGLIAWDGERTHRVDLLRRIYAVRNGGAEPPLESLLRCLRSVWAHVADFDDDQPPDERLFARTEQNTYRLNPVWWRASLPDRVYQCAVCQRVQGGAFGGVCLRYGCPGKVDAEPGDRSRGDHYRSLAEQPLPGHMRVEEHTAQLSNELAREFQRDFKRGDIDVLSCSTTFELGVDLGDLDAVFLRNVPPESFNYAQRVGRAARRAGRPGFAITYCSRAPHDLFYFGDPLRILRGDTRPPVLRLQNERIATRHITSVALSRFFRADPERFGVVRDLLGDMAMPDLVARFRSFVTDHHAELSGPLMRILPAELHERYGLGAASPAWIDDISGTESKIALAELEMSAEYAGIREYEGEAAAARNYSDARWAMSRARTLEGGDVLGFLSRKTVIPKYGFPTDVVGLDTSLSSDESRVELDRDLAIAISEFAPGASLIANKLEWKSYAVKRVPDREWDRASYAVCRAHGVFEHWRDHEQRDPSRACCDKLLDGEQTYIRPEFGFTTSRDQRPAQPHGRPRKEHSTRPYVIASAGAANAFVDLPFATPCVRVHKPAQHEMVVICEGRLGTGFLICPSCGAGVPPSGRAKNPRHRTPLGRSCSGRPTRVSLAHTFKTDVIRLQFLRPLPPGVRTTQGFGWSLGYALVEGAAAATGAPAADLSVTVTYDPAHSIPPVILYDAVPGGAGLVASLEDEARLRLAIEQAIERVRGGCGCGELESCYGCLRNYRNQFMHSDLQRGPVRQYLEAVLAEW